MIKLYVFYIVLGFYMLYYSMLLWVFPFEEAMLQTEIALVASVVMFFIAPAISLYQPRVAPVLGLICLAGISPFGIHWLQYKLMDEYFNIWKPENVLMYGAVVWYLITLIATINAYLIRQNYKPVYFNKTVKFVLSVLPLAIFAVLAVYFVHNN